MPSLLASALLPFFFFGGGIAENPLLTIDFCSSDKSIAALGSTVSSFRLTAAAFAAATAAAIEGGASGLALPLPVPDPLATGPS